MKANKESFSALAETAIVKVQGKITQAKKTTSLFPKNWRKPQEGERLVYRRTPLFSAYVFIVSLSVLAFVGQWYFYMGLTETQTVVTADEKSGEYKSCRGLKKDDVYGKLWSHEQCMGQWKEPSVASLVQDFTFEPEPDYELPPIIDGYSYFPFGNDGKRMTIVNKDRCSFKLDSAEGLTNDKYGTKYFPPFLINFSTPFDVQTNCASSSLKDYFDGTRCGVYNYTTNDSHSDAAFSIVYVGNDEAVSGYNYDMPEEPNFFTRDESTGLTYGSANEYYVYEYNYRLSHYWKLPAYTQKWSSDERCVPFEKHCIAEAYKYLLEKQDASCHLCEHFKSNAPFSCTKEIKKTSLEVLSLSVSNTFAFFSFLVAVTPMVFMLWKKIRVVAVVEVDEEAAENAVEAKGGSEEKQEEDIRST